MDYIFNGVILIALAIIFYYQKYKISALDTALKSQSSILSSIQTYFNIFNIDTVHKYVNLKEENVKMEYDKKFEEITKESKDKINQIMENTVPKEKVAQLYDLIINEVKSKTELTIALFSFIPPEQRVFVKSLLKNERALKEFDELEKEMKTIYWPPQLQPKISDILLIRKKDD